MLSRQVRLWDDFGLIYLLQDSFQAHSQGSEVFWGVSAWLALPLKLSLESSPVSAWGNVKVLALGAFFFRITCTLLGVTFLSFDVSFSPRDDLFHRISRLLGEKFIELAGSQAVLESPDEEFLVRIRYLDGGVLEPG